MRNKLSSFKSVTACDVGGGRKGNEEIRIEKDIQLLARRRKEEQIGRVRGRHKMTSFGGFGLDDRSP